MSDIFGMDENKNNDSEFPINENMEASTGKEDIEEKNFEFDLPLNQDEDTQMSEFDDDLNNIKNNLGADNLAIDHIISSNEDFSSTFDKTDENSTIDSGEDNFSNADNINNEEKYISAEEEKNDYTYQEKKSVDDILKPKKIKKGADKLKRQTILTIVSISFLALFLVTFFNLDKKKDDPKTDEIQSASRAYVPDFESMANNSYNQEVLTEEVPNLNSEFTEDELIASANQEVDNALNQVGVAPTREIPNSQGQGRSRNVQPDTRNNYIQKQIQGIKGLTPTGRQQQNQNTFSQQSQKAQSNNPYSKFSFPSLPSKEDFIQQMLSAQGLQGGFMNTGNNQSPQAGKENFYSKNMGQMSNGEFLNSLTVWQGTIIPAVLVTGINTDLPGNVIARVTQNIYSSLNGNFLLIPQGTLLFAEYNSSVSYAQKRVQVGWNYMIRPDGFAVNLGNMAGVDNQGFSGYKGKVNNHPWAFVKGLLLVSAISIFDASLEQIEQNPKNAENTNPLQDPYTKKIADNLKNPYSRISNKIIDRALDIQPTIKIKPGVTINILTNSNLLLPPVEIPEVTQKYVRYR